VDARGTYRFYVEPAAETIEILSEINLTRDLTDFLLT
jgi:hypothetical protein